MQLGIAQYRVVVIIISIAIIAQSCRIKRIKKMSWCRNVSGAVPQPSRFLSSVAYTMCVITRTGIIYYVIYSWRGSMLRQRVMLHVYTIHINRMSYGVFAARLQYILH